MFGINVFKNFTRAIEESPATFTIEKNSYRAQKEWPPDFTKLSPKYQLRFERRYRRRAKLKGTKPSWNRNLGLFAAGTSFSSRSPLHLLQDALADIPCLGFVAYTVLFMDLGTGAERNPFAGVGISSHKPRKFYQNGMLTTRIGSELDIQPEGLNMDAERSANRGLKSARDGDTWL